MRFVLVDRVLEIRYFDFMKAVKCVSLSDDIFNEHFPGHPVFPGSLLIEALAQASAMLIQASLSNEGLEMRQCLLLMVNRMKLKKPVMPGDKILLTCKITSRLDRSFLLKVEAEVDGDVRAEGELTMGLLDFVDPELKASLDFLFKPCFTGAKTIP